ncbi:MAG TPA: hypothetical protein VNN07_14695, partial [Candidatus Tectomicrobia bacterium]|nr:hypothetical protein [Candidatus Tectomicrobia bacterium]
VVDPHTGQGLMMTRALGDRGLRHVGVVPDPECRATTVGPDDVAVVVATDGLWDVLAEPEVAVIARAEEDAEAAAARLVGAVIERDGPDNVAVVVARLA